MSNEKLDNILKNNGPEEISDDMLDAVAGGNGTDSGVIPKYSVGDVVKINLPTIDYCPSCARLLKYYDATITGVRGILNGNPVYWITMKCCGHKTSVLENVILYKL